MKFSENWLRRHVATPASRDELAATLTAIGLEVEELAVFGAGLDGVVVARIVECGCVATNSSVRNVPFV